jgi:hypothetical protein
MIGACVLMWCLGQTAALSERVTFMHDVRGSHVTEEMFAYEVPWALAGFVHQSGETDAVFGGVLPVKVTVLNGYLSIEAGAIVASAAVPHTGTHANFMERVQLRLTNWLALTYWHWSNASLGRRNPGVDALGVTVLFRARSRSRDTDQ